MSEQTELSIIKAERLNKLKERVKIECLRRKYPYGNFTVGANDKGKPVDQYGEDDWDFNPEPSSGLDILTETYKNISIPIRKINHKGAQSTASSGIKIPNGPFDRIVTDEDITLFEVELTALESRAIDDKTSTDCSVSCTGTCTTVCTGTCSGSATGGDVCTSCSSNCSGICGNSCSSNCSSFCGGAACSGYCGYGCVGNCVVSCYSAASKGQRGQAGAAAKYGVTISPTTCLDSCVSSCRKGCGQDCGVNCGNACSTYLVNIVKWPYTGALENRQHVSPNTYDYSTKTNRYWAFNVVLPERKYIPLSQSYPKNSFCKGIAPSSSHVDPYYGLDLQGINQMQGDGTATISEAMQSGYLYRLDFNQKDPLWTRNKADHYIGQSGNKAIVEQIYRINILRTNFFEEGKNS